MKIIRNNFPKHCVTKCSCVLGSVDRQISLLKFFLEAPKTQSTSKMWSNEPFQSYGASIEGQKSY